MILPSDIVPMENDGKKLIIVIWCISMLMCGLLATCDWCICFVWLIFLILRWIYLICFVVSCDWTMNIEPFEPCIIKLVGWASVSVVVWGGSVGMWRIDVYIHCE